MQEIQRQFTNYITRFVEYAFKSEEDEEVQLKAQILRMTHILEKGLSMTDYRQNRGRDAFDCLTSLLQVYSRKYGTEEDFYRTALCAVYEYVRANNKEDYEELYNIYLSIPGEKNSNAGYTVYNARAKSYYQSINYEELMKSRHSIRHFSEQPLDVVSITKAIELAQFTPSACNRQGWKTRIIINPEIKEEVLNNQNGNKGFGSEIDKLILVTSDLRYVNLDREAFQAYIDGGMYAMSLILSLQYMGIASIPLSMSLQSSQEDKVRSLLELHEAEVLILLIGVGNYPEICKITRSNRIDPDYVIIE